MCFVLDLLPKSKDNTEVVALHLKLVVSHMCFEYENFK